MKPWFEKEAKIIPFPKKPERQVIKMPSVSEYPDFITGVLDLQARRDKGQIGKDSYNRLYQDLIHRFMKKESFETPWFLREQNQTNVGQAAQDLIATANASDDPKYEKETQNLLVKARDFLKNILNKPQTEDVSPQVEALPNEIMTLLQKVKTDAGYTPAQLKEVETQLIQAFGRKQREAVDQYKTKTADLKKGIQDLISQLITKFSPTEANDPTRLEQIRSFFTVNKISEEETRKFLELAIAGKVINMETLVAARVGQITDHVNPQTRNVYDKVYKSFMFLQPAKATGRGNLGSGEIFFVLLGSPAEKGSKGDLSVRIDGKEQKLEVKASRRASRGTRSGGRMDGGSKSAKDTMEGWKELLKKHLGITDTTKTVLKKGEEVEAFAFNISGDGLRRVNDKIKQDNIPRETVVRFTQEMLDLFHTQKQDHSKIANFMVNKDGTIDTAMNRNLEKKIDNKFIRGIALANYHNYKKADKFNALLMINIDTQDYELLTSYKDYSDNLAKGKTSISNGITFTDKANKAALQVFTNPKA